MSATKIGRPSLGDRARRNTITCMITDAERQVIVSAARDRGMSLAEYLRQSALEPVAGVTRGDHGPMAGVRRSA